MTTALPEGFNWDKNVDMTIAQHVSAQVNNDLLKACEKLLDYAMNENWPPMYVLANAREAIDSAKRARGAKG